MEVLSTKTTNPNLSTVVVLLVIFLFIFSLIVSFIYTGAQWKMRRDFITLKKKLIKKLEKNKKVNSGL